MIQIKKTKSVIMSYYPEMRELHLAVFREKEPEGAGATFIIIPMNKIYQVKRGLESATQRFYRKGIKHDK